ncbi:MAG: hemolysin family protein [Pseudomonadota bacterium]
MHRSTNGHQPSGDNSSSFEAKAAPQRGVLAFLLGLIGKSTDMQSGNDQLSQSIAERHEAAALVNNAMNLHALEVGDVMIPGADIIAFSANLKISETIRQAVEKPHSRYPIWGRDRDDVIGFVHIKDMLVAIVDGKQDQKNLNDIRRPILLAVRTTPAFEMLLRMRSERTHMAVVVDEHGGVDGLVTIENVLEQIVGEINDEHDSEDRGQLSQLEDGTILADARLRLDVLEARFGAFLTSEEREEADTLGGLIVTHEGRVPVVGEIIRHEHSGLEFLILSANPRLLRRIQILNPSGRDLHARALVR